MSRYNFIFLNKGAALMLLFCFLISVELLPQSEDLLYEEKEHTFRVDTILISGNKITEDFVILNELTFKQGEIINNNILNFNRERIYSLGLFNKVTLNKTNENEKTFVNVEVEESWYIFPLPFVQVREREYKKLSYGIYLIYKNFRGRNETIFGSVSLGYNPSLGINYINPNLNSEGNYFLRFSTYFSKNKNRSLFAEREAGSQFNFNRFFSSLIIGKRFNQFNKLFGSLSYEYLEVDKIISNYTISSERIDRYPVFGIGYEFDNRDLVQFATKGNYFFIGTNFNGIGINSINYQSLKTDFRHYFQFIDNIFLKYRTSTRTTIGKKIPIYDYSLIGAEEKIRGNFFNRIEDRNFLLISAELFYPIIKEMHMDLTFIPIIPNQLLSYRIAIYLQSFADYGKVFNNFYETTNSLAGFGFGLTLLVLPHNVIRFELGFNQNFRKEFIIDIGTSF